MAENNQRNAQGRRTDGRAAVAPPALNPLVPSLTQPTKSLVERGYISSITCVFEPTGCRVVGRAGVKLRNDEFLADKDYPVGELIERARQLKLVGKTQKSGSGPKVQLPLKSLCKHDFEESKIAGLQARCNAVASAAGGAPLVGRVRSAGRFTGEQTTAFADWWLKATPNDRLLALTNAGGRKEVTETMSANMANIQCPFRGTLDFVVAEDDEEGDGDGSEEPTKSSAAPQGAASSAQK